MKFAKWKTYGSMKCSFFALQPNVDFMCNLSGSGRYHNDVGGMLPLIFNLMQICVALVHGFKAISHQLSQKLKNIDAIV